MRQEGGRQFAARTRAEDVHRGAVNGVEAGAVDDHRAALQQRGLDVGDGEVGVEAGGGQRMAINPGDAGQSRRRRTLQQGKAGIGLDETRVGVDHHDGHEALTQRDSGRHRHH